MFTLPELPFAKDSLAPHISQETLDFHYGKHHQGYVNNLNKLIEDSEFAGKQLEEIIKSASGGIFNNAAQVYNHTFYWNCLSPNGGGEPSGELGTAVNSIFGSFDTFKEEFTQKAATLFGSGWCWLVKRADGSLDIVQSSNAGCPLTDGLSPILTVDVWEHAYYIDYRNARPEYLKHFMGLINWEFAEKNFNK